MVNVPVTYRDAGAYSATADTTPIDVPYPAAAATNVGDLLVLLVLVKPNAVPPTIPTGWSDPIAYTSGSIGTGTAGVGVGTLQLYVLTRTVPVGGLTGNLSVTIGGSPNSYIGLIVQLKTPATGYSGVTFTAPTGTTYSRTVASTTFGGTGGANLSVTTNDLLMFVSASPDDQSNDHESGGLMALTASGATLATPVSLGTGITTTGGDCSMCVGYALVTAGTETSVPTSTLTANSSETGGGVFLRFNATGTALASVTGTKAAAWDVRESIESDKAAAWHVRERVQQTQDSAWNIAEGLTEVTATRDSAWHVRASVEQTKDAAWRILTTGVWHAVYTLMTASDIAPGATITTVTSSTATTARAGAVHGFTGVDNTLRGTVVHGGSRTGTPSVNSDGTLAANDLVVGTVGAVTVLPTGDADTTNGSWSALSGAVTNGAVVEVAAAVQSKVVSATGTQTFNPTASDESVVSIFTLTPTGGVTSVTGSASSAWHVRVAVEPTATSAWHVRALVQPTAPSAWHVRAAVQQTQDSAWQVRAAVQAARDSAWSVRTAVQQTKAAAWHVRAQAQATRDVAWNIASNLVSVTSTKASAWSIVGRLTATRDSAWTVRTGVGTATAASAWHIRVAVLSTRDSAWTVRTTVAPATRDSAWAVRAAVQQTAATAWQVRAAVQATSATAWHVRAQAQATRTSAWHIKASLTATRDSAWNIASNLVSVTGTKPTAWNITGRITSTQPTTWNVWTNVGTASRSSAWYVRAQVQQTKASAWKITGRIVVTRDSAWSVRSVVQCTQPSTWNVWTAVAPATRDSAWHIRETITAQKATAWNVEFLAAFLTVHVTGPASQRIGGSARLGTLTGARFGGTLGGNGPRERT